MNPRTFAVCAVLAVAGTAAGAAALDFREPAPESHAIASTGRGVLAIETSVGPVYLRVAPSRDGGFCHVIDIPASRRPDGSPNAGGGCSPQPPRSGRPFVAGPVDGTTFTRRGYLRLLHGRVGDDVASVEMRFGDDDRATIEPVEGFFLRELAEDDELMVVIARDADGTELERRSMQARFPRRDLPFPIGPSRKLIELETSEGFPMVFSLASGTNGTECAETRYRGARAGGCNAPLADATAINVGHALWNEDEDEETEVVVLQGSIGRKIERLEVWYRDGSASRIPIVERHVLFEVPKGLTPRLLVGLDASGGIVARRPIR
jgi:hypothetical protein